MSFSFSITSPSKDHAKRRAARLVANNSIPISVAAFIVSAIDGLTTPATGSLIRITGAGHMPEAGGGGWGGSADIKIEVVSADSD
jgi:hypothetical protein